jgi:hypothetical protein
MESATFVPATLINAFVAHEFPPHCGKGTDRVRHRLPHAKIDLKHQFGD